MSFLHSIVTDDKYNVLEIKPYFIIIISYLFSFYLSSVFIGINIIFIICIKLLRISTLNEQNSRAIITWCKIFHVTLVEARDHLFFTSIIIILLHLYIKWYKCLWMLILKASIDVCIESYYSYAFPFGNSVLSGGAKQIYFNI